MRRMLEVSLESPDPADDAVRMLLDFRLGYELRAQVTVIISACWFAFMFRVIHTARLPSNSSGFGFSVTPKDSTCQS